MKCAICAREMRPLTDGDANDEQSPIHRDRCMACFVAGLELEKFLIRVSDRTVMGDWTAGWLREIITDPARYR
jgi:hypothetical protein